jgi:hypothetical protein
MSRENMSLSPFPGPIGLSLEAELAGGYLRVFPTVTGQITDLYDFWLSGGGLSYYAAEVEAGYLAAGSPGHIFKEEINLSDRMQMMNLNLDSLPTHG